MKRMDFTPEALVKRYPETFGGLGKEAMPEEIEKHERRERERAEAVHLQQRRIDARDFLRGRGERYRHCRLSTFEVTVPEQRVALNRLREFCRRLPEETDVGNGIVLFGPSGTGKDHLVVAVAYAAIRQFSISVYWKNGMELFADMRATIDGERSEADVIRPLTSAQILVLSDPLPPEGELTRYQRETLYRVLETRYSARKPTWATLNVKDGTEASQRLGAPCHDRLRHGALAVYCNWPSYRTPRGTDEIGKVPR